MNRNRMFRSVAALVLMAFIVAVGIAAAARSTKVTTSAAEALAAWRLGEHSASQAASTIGDALAAWRQGEKQAGGANSLAPYSAAAIDRYLRLKQLGGRSPRVDRALIEWRQGEQHAGKAALPKNLDRGPELWTPGARQTSSAVALEPHERNPLLSAYRQREQWASDSAQALSRRAR
ncbi:MAG TPA: hypothetical protein VJG32_05885 [Anaerolineae bacterium]|nr:hypothetical protein [Anaerolineae bacterium]